MILVVIDSIVTYVNKPQADSTYQDLFPSSNNDILLLLQPINVTKGTLNNILEESKPKVMLLILFQDWILKVEETCTINDRDKYNILLEDMKCNMKLVGLEILKFSIDNANISKATSKLARESLNMSELETYSQGLPNIQANAEVNQISPL